MSTRWSTLTNRLGDKANSSPPTDSEFLVAATEVLDEAAALAGHPELSQGALIEHPNAWLESGVEDGCLELLDLYRGGRMEFVRFSDADMTEELRRSSLFGVTVTRAVSLWQALRDGRVAELEETFP